MHSTEVQWTARRTPTPANLANPAKSRINARFAGLRMGCESCEFAAVVTLPLTAANSANSRINACDSQNSQLPRTSIVDPPGGGQHAATTRSPIRNIRNPFATDGTRINASDSQDSQDSQGVGPTNAIAAVATALLGAASVYLKPYPTHRVRRHVMGD